MNGNNLDVGAILQRVAEVATLAGLRGDINQEDGRYETGFCYDSGRSQSVYVRPIRTPGGPGVCVYSPAAIYKKGLFKGLSKEDAVELLRRNDNLCFARFGLADFKEEIAVVASVDLLVETMDPDELSAAIQSTAAAADGWERKLGQDTF